MSGSAYSFTRKIIFLGRIVSPCTYTSFCRAITFDNQPWLFAWKRAASVSVSRVNSLYNPCDEFLVGFFPPSPVSVVFEQLPLYRCFGDVHRGVDTISREKLPDVYFRSCRAASKMNKLISKLQYRSCIYIYIYIQGNQNRGETSSPLRKAKRAWYSLRMVSLGVWAEISWQNNYHGTMMIYSSFVLI